LGELQFETSPRKKLMKLISTNKTGVVVCVCGPSYLGRIVGGSRLEADTRYKRVKVVKHLPSKPRALSSKPNTTKRKKKYRKETGRTPC
jgi:hypothetical protein